MRKSVCELVNWEEMDVNDIYIELLSGSKEPKQLGGLVYSLLPSAISSAISSAYNTEILSIPLQNNYVYQAFSKKEADSPSLDSEPTVPAAEDLQ